MTDWNGDGTGDVLFGDRAGNVNYYQRNSDATLTAKGYVKANNQAINMTQAASICIVDWNNDGLKDLVYSACIWTPKNPIRVYLNKGTRAEPVFTDFFTIKCNGQDIVASFPQMEIQDFTGDEKKDLLLVDCFYNSNTNVDTSDFYFYENTGTDANPVFSARESMVYQGKKIARKLARMDVQDLNQDGGFDLLFTSTSEEMTLYWGKPGITQITKQLQTQPRAPVIAYTKAANCLLLCQKPDAEAAVALYDTQGRIRYSWKVSETTRSLALPALGSGIYYVQYETLSKPVVQKILIGQ